MTESEDLSIAGVSCGEYPSESADNKANQSREQGHERSRVAVSPMPETGGITARMNLRRAQGSTVAIAPRSVRSSSVRPRY